jgi:hypothetical protein
MHLGVSVSFVMLGLLSIDRAIAAPTLITSCGTVIGVSGLYEVKNELNATDTGTCITITASHVTLGLAANITGIHAGVGISIRGLGVVIRGSGTDHDDVPTVSGFSIGVEDNAGQGVIGDFKVSSNGTGLLLQGAVNIPTIIDTMIVQGNTEDGIRVTSPTGIRGASFITKENGKSGLLLAAGSQRSVLAEFVSEDNGGDAINVSSSSNVIYGCIVKGGKFGLVIEKQAVGNTVVLCTNDGRPPSKQEALDKNGSCDQNVWYGNDFSRKHKPACVSAETVGTPIKKCKTIKSSGVYYLTKDITATAGDCLIVKAKDVTLTMNGHTVHGSGAGIGVHVLQSAANFKALNAGGIENFANGILVEADGATIKGFGSNNNTDAGVFVDGARGVDLGDAGVGDNGKYGIHLRNASRLLAHNYGAGSNGTYGVFVEHSNDNVFTDFATGNLGANGIAGFYVGCSTTGPSANCTDIPSRRNVVAHAAGALNTQYGWAIDVGSTDNVFANLNGSGNGVFDMYEGNAGPKCGGNIWIFDVPGTSNNPGCLQ